MSVCCCCCCLFRLSPGTFGYPLLHFDLSTRRKWSVSRPGLLTPRERTPGTHRIGGRVGPRSGLDAVENRIISSPRRESNPRTQSTLSKSVNTKSLILLLALYGCETWSFILRKQNMFKLFENTVLRRLVEPKIEEVKRDWRK
jgi:hypothetical protein